MPKPLPSKLRVGLRQDAHNTNARTISPCLKIRVELLEEWHAQCVDPMGCRLPVFWIKSGDAWYRLGKPLEEYRSFLVQESLWLLATYRCAFFLTQCPRANFDDALAVIGGRNWLRAATGGPGSIAGSQSRSVCLSVCPSVSLSVHIRICRVVYPRLVCLSLSLSIYLSQTRLHTLTHSHSPT